MCLEVVVFLQFPRDAAATWISSSSATAAFADDAINMLSLGRIALCVETILIQFRPLTILYFSLAVACTSGGKS